MEVVATRLPSEMRLVVTILRDSDQLKGRVGSLPSSHDIYISDGSIKYILFEGMSPTSCSLLIWLASVLVKISFLVSLMITPISRSLLSASTELDLRSFISLLIKAMLRDRLR